MHTKIATEYHFCSSHSLPHVPEEHRCRRNHGHNYMLRVTIYGEPLHEGHTQGMLIDFYDVDKVVQPLVDMIDHRYLNDIPGLENPTAELIAAWFAVRIRDKLKGRRVTCRVYETPSCYAEVTDPCN